MSTLMGRVEKLSENSAAKLRPGHVGGSETANKSVQTEFPVSLLGKFNGLKIKNLGSAPGFKITLVLIWSDDQVYTY